MTPTPMIYVLGPLLLTTGVLLVAYIKVQRANNDLRAKLEMAQQRRKSDERELSQRSALDHLKDEFVSTVSHELRTPLTSIRGALGLVSSGLLGNVDAKAHNLLRIALTNTDRLIRLINEILDLERMDSGRSVLQMKRCSLPDLLHQAMETMNSMAEEADVQLTVSPAAKSILPSVFFDGDPDRIIQVLTNLISNAIKFSPPGSSVTIEVETPPDALIFKVSDQGRGIPQDQLETIFERFKQLEHSDALQRGGTGLGLAICRSIVQQHGGTIWAQRNPVKGVSMCVKLPRLQRTYDVAMPALPSTSHDTAGEITGDFEGQVESAVLVCDDDTAHRSLIVEQLRDRGHTVLEASSSEGAIEIAKARLAQSPLQAILLDLHMSDMKGWEILRVLTRNTATASVPIVVLSIDRPATAADNNGSKTPLQGQQAEDHLFADLGRALDSGSGSSHVLLVEDDEDLAGVVIEGFAKTNVIVNHVSSLQRAMAVCRDRRPDLMILDLTLPDGDGFSLVEWLRGRPELRSLPLIVYSGREVPDEERTKLRLGPTRFLTKARVQTQDVEQLVLSMVLRSRADRTEDVYHAPGQSPSAAPPQFPGSSPLQL